MDWWTCGQCGKRAYPTRAKAAAVRRGHRNRTHLGLYRCRSAGDLVAWHLGHKPPALIAGKITRDQLL